MKAIILLAGYATRLYPLTINTPKALLDINGKLVIDFIFDEIETIEAIDEVYMITNHKFFDHFVNWKNCKNTNKKIIVLDDGTSTDEAKLGAIGDIQFVIESQRIDDDIIVLAGDNIFTYKLLDLYAYYQKTHYDTILVQSLNDTEELKRMGVVLIDSNNKVLNMEEKPVNPRSNMAAYATYIYNKDTIPLFNQYLRSGNNPDAPGNFPAWLCSRKDVYAYVFDGECYDIGTPKAYKEVREIFKNK